MGGPRRARSGRGVDPGWSWERLWCLGMGGSREVARAGELRYLSYVGVRAKVRSAPGTRVERRLMVVPAGPSGAGGLNFERRVTTEPAERVRMRPTGGPPEPRCPCRVMGPNSSE